MILDLVETDEQQSGATATLRSGETVERIAAALKVGILEGRFAPGQRLISRDIVEQFGVSRSSLREAFRRLEADGLVDVVPNRGAIVRVVSAEEIFRVCQIREALEGFAAQTAASNVDQYDFRDQLIAVLNRGRVHRSRPVFVDFVKDNRDFHQQIVNMTGNPNLNALVDKYQLPVFMIQLRRVLSMEAVISKALDEHEVIAEAILAGDSPGAYDAMKRHLWRSANQMIALCEADAADINRQA